MKIKHAEIGIFTQLSTPGGGYPRRQLSRKDLLATRPPRSFDSKNNTTHVVAAILISL